MCGHCEMCKADSVTFDLQLGPRPSFVLDDRSVYGSEVLAHVRLTCPLICFRLRLRAHGMVERAWQRSSVPTGSSMFSLLLVDTSPLSWWLVRRWASALWTPDMRPQLSSLLMLWRGSQVQLPHRDGNF